MLVLTRKLMEKLYIGDAICVTVVRIEGDQVRLGIDAPREIAVVRDELKPRPGSAAPSAGPPHAPPAPAEPAPNPALRQVAELMRAPVVICSPETPIREAARLMSEAAATSVVVDLGDGTLGIMTDRDLRSRVVAAGVDTGAPVSTAMSAPQHSYGNVSAPCDRIVSSGAPSMNVCPRVAGGDCGDAEALSVLIQINTRSVRL